MLTGDYWDGGILLAYGSTVIGLADNILRPLLVGRDTKLPDFRRAAVRLGDVFFGMDGFVTGPTAVLSSVWQIFHCGVRGKRAEPPQLPLYPALSPVRPQPDSSVPTKAKKSTAIPRATVILSEKQESPPT